MLRSITRRLVGTATSTARLAFTLPIAVTRGVVERVTRLAPGSEEGPADAPARPQAVPPTPPETRETEDDGPHVVLTLDAPAEDVEPPEDVVGETLAAERPVPPQPQHVESQAEVVYSSSSDED